MTSSTNHDATISFFEDHGYFGLDKRRVVFFQQDMLPAVDEQGKILLADKARIAFAPSGTGAVYSSLHRAGILKRMSLKGISLLYYFQVDNPLVVVADPLFIGHHLLANAEMSTKVVEKAYPEEKVGLLVKSGGVTRLVEYSDFPSSLAAQRGADGKLLFRAGNIAIHVLNRDFVERVATSLKLPFHAAHKKVSYIDERGVIVHPEQPNAYKFEHFVFDALPRAARPLVFEVDRREEFAPVKNREGKDSPAEARALMIHQSKQWLSAVGVDNSIVDRLVVVEISPLLAATKDDFVALMKKKVSWLNHQLAGHTRVYLAPSS